jgi:transcriptional regulator with XRE-family HTH domain
MSKECVNRYQTSRVNAGLTQEQAAALLHISVRTLSDYENSKIPPDDIVAAMTKIYRDKKLISHYIREAHPALADDLPEPFDIENIYHAIFEYDMLIEEATKEVAELRATAANKNITAEERDKLFRERKKKRSAS